MDARTAIGVTTGAYFEVEGAVDLIRDAGGKAGKLVRFISLLGVECSRWEYSFS